MKNKLTVYLDDDVRKMLDEMHVWSIKIGNKKTLSFFVSESIKVMHECVMEKTRD